MTTIGIQRYAGQIARLHSHLRQDPSLSVSSFIGRYNSNQLIMHSTSDRVFLRYPQHAVSHHNPCSTLHNVVCDLSSVQLGGVYAVHPVGFSIFVFFLTEIRIPQTHPVWQDNFFLPERDALVGVLPALVQSRDQQRGTHLPKADHRIRRTAVNVDDLFRRHAMRQQLVLGTSVGDFQHLVHVVLPVNEALYIGFVYA